MSTYKYFGKVGGRTVKGPITASTMNSAMALVAKAYGLGRPSCESESEAVHLSSGSDFVEITLAGTVQKRAARVSCSHS